MSDRGRSPERLRVLIVDDHDVVHWGFRMMLSQRKWIERCLSAHCAQEALDLTKRYRPHVALVDLFIGEESGAEICEQIRATEPSTYVLFLSGAGEISPAAARAAGASGFAHKNWSAERIAGAVRAVGLGHTLFTRDSTAGPLGLSQREITVLQLIARGASNPEIAGELNLSRHTVKEQVSLLYRKLDVRNRVEAVQRAQRLGLLA